DVHESCGMSHGCETSPSRSTPGEHLPGGHVVRLVPQDREAPLAEATVRGPEDVDEPPMVVPELLVEELVAWRVEVRLDEIGDATDVGPVRVPVRWASAWVRQIHELLRIVPDDLVAERDPVPRQVCAPALGAHAVDTAVDLQVRLGREDLVEPALEL